MRRLSRGFVRLLRLLPRDTLCAASFHSERFRHVSAESQSWLFPRESILAFFFMRLPIRKPLSSIPFMPNVNVEDDGVNCQLFERMSITCAATEASDKIGILHLTLATESSITCAATEASDKIGTAAATSLALGFAFVCACVCICLCLRTVDFWGG